MKKFGVYAFIGMAILFTGHVHASDACRSYSTRIAIGETICFAKTKLQYRCASGSGGPVINYVQTLVFKPELRSEGGRCDHVDSSNLKPNGSPNGTRINMDKPR